MIYDYGILMPATTDFATMPKPTIDAIQLLGAEWPSFPAIGTKIYNGYGIAYIRMNKKLTKIELEALFTQYSLPWTVLGIRSAYKIKPEVVGKDPIGNDIIVMKYDTVLAIPRDTTTYNYLDNIINIDAMNNVTSRRPTTNDSTYIATFAGTDPIKL